MYVLWDQQSIVYYKLLNISGAIRIQCTLPVSVNPHNTLLEKCQLIRQDTMKCFYHYDNALSHSYFWSKTSSSAPPVTCYPIQLIYWSSLLFDFDMLLSNGHAMSQQIYYSYESFRKLLLIRRCEEI